MYPQEDLMRLGARKKELVGQIAESRMCCADAVAVLSGPLSQVDRSWTLWHKVAPFAKLAVSSMGTFLPRTRPGGKKWLWTLVRWAPLAFKITNEFRRRK